MDSTYAPQSPDLSSFLSSPPQQQQQLQQGGQQPTSQNGSAAYAPRSPVIPSFGKQQQQQQQHNPNYTQPQFAAYQQNLNTHASFDGTSDFEYNPQYMPPIPPLPPAHSFVDQPSFMTPASFDDNPPNLQSFAGEHTQAYFQPKSEPTYNSYPSNMSHAAPAFKSESSAPSAPPPYRNPNPNNVEIKTKFPVARIKRIMQADEEVGKVAQVTPVAVNKALELFMIALVEGAAAKAREKGGKRITAQHLKMVVQGDDQFDFLGEIVGRVAEVQEGAGGEGRKRKEKVKESDSEEEEKKVRKPRGRKKKTDD